ncbi:MAG: cytochrome c biogenesis protein CcsA [Polyangia bacterium]
MIGLLHVLEILLPLLYAVALVAYGLYFVDRRSGLGRWSTPLLWATVAAHIAYSVLRGLEFEHHPMASVYEVLSIVAFSLAFVYLIIELWRRNRSTGAFVLPFVVGVQLAASIGMGPTRQIDPLLRSGMFGLHTGTVALGYAALFLSAVYAVMYLLLHRALRRKQFGRVFDRLPSLSVLARMNRGAALVGVVFLGVAIGVGIWWAADEIPRFWDEPRVWTTVAVWAVFALAAACHYVLRWPARRVAVISLAGFVLLVAATLSVNALPASWHRFGVG